MPFARNGQAQSYQFTSFGIRDGLIHESTYSINQGKNGFLWITTSEGICRFDGVRFTSQFMGDTLPSSVANTSFLDSRGRLWFGYMDGSAVYFENNHFHLVPVPDTLRSSINAIAEDPEGRVCLITQRTGMIRVDRENSLSAVTEPFEGINLSSFAFTGEGNILMGTFDGLSLFVKQGDSYVHSGDFSEIAYTQVQVIKQGPYGAWWIGTADEGLYRINGQGNSVSDFIVEKAGVDQGLEYASVSSVDFESSSKIWIADYGYGVYRFDLDESGKLSAKETFTAGETGGLPDNYIKEIYIDAEGNHWFASQGHGIAILRDQAFLFYDFGDRKFMPDITSVLAEGDRVWFGGKGKIAMKLQSYDKVLSVISAPNGLPSDIVTALYNDSNGDLWIGTAQNGLYRKKNGSNTVQQVFRSNNSLENNINAIDGAPGLIWVASNNGVYSMDISTLERKHFNTTNGLPHNLINDIYVDPEGRVWLATRTSGLFCLDEEYSRKIDNDPKLEFLSLVPDGQGNIWAGTNGDGLFMFGPDTTLKYFTTENGLRSNFCYAVGLDPEGNIWVGHRLGLSKIMTTVGRVASFDKEAGFTSDIYHNAISTGRNNKVYFGTNDGLIIYDANQARVDTIPPRLSITDIRINDVSYDPTQPIRLPYGIYKIRIDYVGINLVNPEQVSYQYMLDGYDDWSEPTRNTSVFYSRVEDGDYTFRLKSCDGSGNCNEVPLELSISVKIPVWKAWWFVVSVILFFILVFFIILKVRERNQKAIQEYLQQQLDERTREVILQKEEIENKNRDITDSINYAQRIQASILPPIKKLHETFGGSFVFYQPRDIVSGDFYWYDKLDNNRFIIVCADSTGHGVPGAFMSMIGTTLIKDICLRPGVKTPSDVLSTLDNEVRTALNQNVESVGSNDGMDIIVAEIDLNTFRFRVSSAMRPVIIYKGGEQIYVKGSRSSVGGLVEEGSDEKAFEYEEFQLSKGDIIYMFSDGYPDQFGGPLGRKFKMVRLKNLLRDIHDKPMEEQYNYIKSNFFLWKEDLEQVDDVLFMGVKL